SGWDDVWYKFTAAAARHIIALQNLGSTLAGGTTFEVYSGDCSSLQSISCGMGSYNDWRFADISSLTIGNTYYIRVSKHVSATDSQQDQLFELSITTPGAAASNIDCASASPLTAPVVGTTQGTASNQVWYSFVAPYDGYTQVEMDYTTPGATLKIYSGACGSQTLLASGNNSSPSLAGFAVQSGRAYYASATVSGSTNTNYAYRLALNSVIALPVHLLSFNASVADNRYVSIDWNTAEESGLDSYEVERSTDGLRFSSLGKLPSKNSKLPLSYHFGDAAPVAGTNYYRLKIVNRDGKIDYSQVTIVVFKGRFTDNLQLFKNGNLVLVRNNTNETKNIVFNLYNAQGQLLGTMYKTVFPGTGAIDIPAVMSSNNVYFIKATIDSKDAKTFSLLW
ncbi:MAG TPA: hypothetical protein VLD19_16020, partial [Chitinophagaceae bacterium]|nr:hypothetical protein [Chitinophagaceae bacterium]